VRRAKSLKSNAGDEAGKYKKQARKQKRKASAAELAAEGYRAEAECEFLKATAVEERCGPAATSLPAGQPPAHSTAPPQAPGG
jgi:hypothetical protein